MGKFQYFDALESLSALMLEAVRLSCEERPAKAGEKSLRITALRQEFDTTLCEIELILFSDFLPPLERDTIAACAHSLSAVLSCACHLGFHSRENPLPRSAIEEAKNCILLAEYLHRHTRLLRTIRKPSEIPAVREFRELLAKANTTNTWMLSQFSNGKLPRSAEKAMQLLGNLRSELGDAFDRLLEIMLRNI